MERQPRRRGERLEERAVPLVELSRAGAFVQDLEDAKHLALHLERGREHRARDEPRRLVHLVDEARIPPGVGDHLRFALQGHVADDARPDRQLDTFDLLARRTAPQLADDAFAVLEPDRARLGVERLDDAVEHPRQQLGGIERRVEFERRPIEQGEIVALPTACGCHDPPRLTYR